MDIRLASIAQVRGQREQARKPAQDGGMPGEQGATPRGGTFPALRLGMMRALAACLVATSFMGCVATEPVATSPSNNPDLHVDTLFTHDGCTIYRFRDLAYHYYVRCQDASPAQTISTLGCGKTCRREEVIQTLPSSSL
jgi:hypothetical protein